MAISGTATLGVLLGDRDVSSVQEIVSAYSSSFCAVNGTLVQDTLGTAIQSKYRKGAVRNSILLGHLQAKHVCLVIRANSLNTEFRSPSQSTATCTKGFSRKMFAEFASDDDFSGRR